MSVAPAEPITPAPTEPSAAAAAPPAGPKPTEPPKAADSAPKANLWDDPKSAQAEIERLRRENGADRVNAKAQAAADAKAELAQTIGKALGLVEDEPIDPAKLTESLTTAQTEAKQARVELAVFRAAPDAAGDPVALLDSTSFLKSLGGIDPSDTAAVQAAITSAVAANPRLGAATEPRTPAPNPAQGAGANGAPSLDSQIAELQKAGNFKAAAALKANQLLEMRKTSNP